MPWSIASTLVTECAILYDDARRLNSRGVCRLVVVVRFDPLRLLDEVAAGVGVGPLELIENLFEALLLRGLGQNAAENEAQSRCHSFRVSVL